MKPIAEPGASGPPDATYGSTAYRWYVVGVLALIYTCHALDRGLPNILIEPIRHEFNLSDSQLGLFSGLAYGVAFSLTSLPLGYLADRTNRRNLLAGAVVVWSILTLFSGMARDFIHLVLARLGVGAAESGAAPISLTMINDLFPPDRRAFAMGVFYASAPVGGVLATALGGYIAAEHGWRTAFFLAGVPGILLAVLAIATIKEPRRGATDSKAETDADAGKAHPKFSEAFAHLKASPGLIFLIGGAVVLSLVNIALNAWMASFFIRLHGLGLTETGLVLGAGAAVCALLAPPLFGLLSDRLAPYNPRWPLRIVWIAGLACMVITNVMLFTPSLMLAIVCFVVSDVLRVGFMPPCFSVLTGRTPARIRGTVLSILFLTMNLIGFGVGPLFTGALSDLFGGGEGLRYALASVSLLFLLAAVFLIAASRGLYGPGKAKAG